MFFKLHVVILLANNSNSRRKSEESLMNQFGVSNAVSIWTELSSNSMQL